ncbi:MAG: GFA family protein [Pseudomonadota bacterium]
MKTGSCLCGGVAYTLSGPLNDSVGCHCIQCRKTSGHYVSATQVQPDQLTLTKTETLTWYTSSPGAQRGFCNRCGASLFWKHEDDDGAVSVMSGTIDGDTGLKTAKHIFTAFKGDYYDIADTVPQRET